MIKTCLHSGQVDHGLFQQVDLGWYMFVTAIYFILRNKRKRSKWDLLEDLCCRPGAGGKACFPQMPLNPGSGSCHFALIHLLLASAQWAFGGLANAPGAGKVVHIKTDRVKGVYTMSVNSRAREAKESEVSQADRLVWAPQPQ